jgi:hypothetical protein
MGGMGRKGKGMEGGRRRGRRGESEEQYSREGGYLSHLMDYVSISNNYLRDRYVKLHETVQLSFCEVRVK